MALREIINIDQEKRTGCGLCVPNCPEGAIQIIDGKARLINDMFCDGLGACLGECPEQAITIEKREAAEYDEITVMGNIVRQGDNTIKAHLKHLADHGETEYLNQALTYLNENNIAIPDYKEQKMSHEGCPGSNSIEFSRDSDNNYDESGKRISQLQHWPVQLHLVPPEAAFFQGKDVLLAADCTAFTMGDFHKDFLKGKSLAIACPKLDSNQEIYREKITAMIDKAKINTLTVMIMEVPCCRGLLNLALQAKDKAGRNVPVKLIVVSLKGEIIKDDWV